MCYVMEGCFVRVCTWELEKTRAIGVCTRAEHNATHSNALQHTTPHCISLQHTEESSRNLCVYARVRVCVRVRKRDSVKVLK